MGIIMGFKMPIDFPEVSYLDLNEKDIPNFVVSHLLQGLDKISAYSSFFVEYR